MAMPFSVIGLPVSDATEVALVCAEQSPPHYHSVAFRDEIVDFISRVGYG